MEYETRQLRLSNPHTKKEWQDFLTSTGISNFGHAEIDNIWYTIGIYSADQLVATGSISKNIFKYIAVCKKIEDHSNVFNSLVSQLETKLAENHIFHNFVFTKPKYSDAFKFVGFKELARSPFSVLLERGNSSIHDYLAQIERPLDFDKLNIGAVVINANPFTLGHRFLIDFAAKKSDLVYVFVVSENISLFSTDERMRLVIDGTKDLDNVKVVSGGEYMVSFATFPSYFLTSKSEEIEHQTTLDAQIFKNFVAPYLNIKTRYLGSEPLSKTTIQYNDVLQRELPPPVKVEVVPRAKDKNNKVISAQFVRRFIKDDNMQAIEDIVPLTTYKFIELNKNNLQKRISEGMNINGN